MLGVVRPGAPSSGLAPVTLTHNLHTNERNNQQKRNTSSVLAFYHLFCLFFTWYGGLKVNILDFQWLPPRRADPRELWKKGPCQGLEPGLSWCPYWSCHQICHSSCRSSLCLCHLCRLCRLCLSLDLPKQFRFKRNTHTHIYIYIVLQFCTAERIDTQVQWQQHVCHYSRAQSGLFT